MASPDFEKFLDQFNEHALRPALQAGKEKLDEVLDSLPTSFITQAVEDAYAQLTSTDTAGTLGAVLDTSKVADAVDSLKAQLQDPQVSLQLAQSVKQLLSQTSTDSIGNVLFKATENASFEQQFAAQLIFAQLSPKIDELRDASVEDIATQIRDLGANLDGQAIAYQVDLLIQDQASQMSQQTEDLKNQLPPAEDVAEAVKDLGNAARDTLDKASKGATFAETVGALKQFSGNANSIVNRILGTTPPSGPQNPVTDKAPPAPKKKNKGKGKGWKI